MSRRAAWQKAYRSAKALRGECNECCRPAVTDRSRCARHLRYGVAANRKHRTRVSARG